MDGRTYWVSPQLESYPLFNQDPEDGTYAERPYGYTSYTVYNKLEVPNGAWVLERTLSSGFSWPVGTTGNEPKSYTLFDGGHFMRVLYCSDKPFGFVLSQEAGWLDDDTFTQVPKGPCRLDYARQIHKGELSPWGVPIPKLKFAREHESLARKYANFPRNRDQKRNPFRWARLSDVAEAAGVSAQRVITECWPFAGLSRTYDQVRNRGGELVQLRHGYTHDEISSQVFFHFHWSIDDLNQYFENGFHGEHLWIRAGLANTFLRLRALGYEPASNVAPTA